MRNVDLLYQFMFISFQVTICFNAFSLFQLTIITLERAELSETWCCQHFANFCHFANFNHTPSVCSMSSKPNKINHRQRVSPAKPLQRTLLLYQPKSSLSDSNKTEKFMVLIQALRVLTQPFQRIYPAEPKRQRSVSFICPFSEPIRSLQKQHLELIPL